MKWLIIQSDGEHKGQDSWSPNWFLRECYSLQHALIVNGESADIWGLRHLNFAETPDFNSYDAVLMVENYEMDWLPDFSRITHPLRIQWLIDLHCHSWNGYLQAAQNMDTFLHSTSFHIAEFKRKEGGFKKHLWFPNAVDDRYFESQNQERNQDIVFIGGKSPSRVRILERMEKETGMFYGYGITGVPYIRALQRAKIGFNKNIAQDINYRTFEVLACGACLLTEIDPDLAELGFKDGENCVLYRSEDEAVARAKEILADGSWSRIGQAGMELARKHTYVERIKYLLTKLP